MTQSNILVYVKLILMISIFSVNCQALYGEIYFKHGKHMIPHPDKVLTRGEDA